MEEVKEDVPCLSCELDWFVDTNVAQNFVCSICQKIPYPSECCDHKECGNVFCREDIQKWQSHDSNKSCPLCKMSNSVIELSIDSNKFVYKMIRDLKAKCPMSKDCKWVGEYGNLDFHILQCSFSKRPCRFYNFGCKFIGTNEELTKHYSESKDLHISHLENKVISLTEVLKQKSA